MPYAALTDRALPYHLDGTVIKQIDATLGVLKTFSEAEMLEMNDEDYVEVTMSQSGVSDNGWLILFFPELVNITQIFAVCLAGESVYSTSRTGPTGIQWSADSTNGLDGTWTEATCPSGFNLATMNLDSWRTNLKPMTNVIGAIALRIQFRAQYQTLVTSYRSMFILHLYGKKQTGETPNDIVFLDAEAADAELTIPLDFGDVPTATSEQRIIKIKNVSATLTASTIVITVVDPDDQIRIGLSNTGPWLTAQTVASLAPAAKSVAFYIKCEAPAAPTPLGPNRAPIKVNVGSWA